MAETVTPIDIKTRAKAWANKQAVYAIEPTSWLNAYDDYLTIARETARADAEKCYEMANKVLIAEFDEVGDAILAAAGIERE